MFSLLAGCIILLRVYRISRFSSSSESLVGGEQGKGVDEEAFMDQCTHPDYTLHPDVNDANCHKTSSDASIARFFRGDSAVTEDNAVQVCRSLANVGSKSSVVPTMYVAERSCSTQLSLSSPGSAPHEMEPAPSMLRTTYTSNAKHSEQLSTASVLPASQKAIAGRRNVQSGYRTSEGDVLAGLDNEVGYSPTPLLRICCRKSDSHVCRRRRKQSHRGSHLNRDTKIWSRSSGMLWPPQGGSLQAVRELRNTHTHIPISA